MGATGGMALHLHWQLHAHSRLFERGNLFESITVEENIETFKRSKVRYDGQRKYQRGMIVPLGYCLQ